MSHEQPPEMMRLPAMQQVSEERVSKTSSTASPFQVGSRYVLLILIWSSTPLAVVLSVKELHPLWALACRFGLSALLAYIVLRGMGLKLRMDFQAVHSYVAGSLSLFGAMTFTYLAAPHLASGLISLLYGLSPLVAGLATVFLFKQQKLFAEQWVGMLIAFLGLMFICMSGDSAYVQPIGVFLIMLALTCYVGSMFWVKHIQAQLHPMEQTTGSLIVSALAMLPLLLFFIAARPTSMPGLVTWTAIIYSVVMGSIVAMICYFDLVERLSPSTVALTTVLTPVFALIWGALFNHEQISSNMLLGVVVIFVGLICYFARDWYQQYILQSDKR